MRKFRLISKDECYLPLEFGRVYNSDLIPNDWTESVGWNADINPSDWEEVVITVKDVRLKHYNKGNNVLGFDLVLIEEVELEPTLELRNYLAEKIQQYILSK